MRRVIVLAVLLAGCGTQPGSDYKGSVPSGPAAGQEQPGPEAIDQDGDGLTAGEEAQFGTSDLSGDTDGDGLHDYDELWIHGTDPVLADTDSDGVNDGAEILIGTDAFSADSDSDGLDDYAEIYTHGTDPGDADSDDDGLNDGAEVDLGTSPLLSDTDNDGLADYTELYVWSTDPTNGDTDGDGFDDGFELRAGMNPLEPSGPPPPAPPPFVAGDIFSFLTQEETEVFVSMRDGVVQRTAMYRTGCYSEAGRGFAKCEGDVLEEMRRRGMSWSGLEAQLIAACHAVADEGRCDCDQQGHRLAIAGFEEVFLDLIGRIGLNLTLNELAEVSRYMHSEFDSRADCHIRDCVQVTNLCAY